MTDLEGNLSLFQVGFGTNTTTSYLVSIHLVLCILQTGKISDDIGGFYLMLQFFGVVFVKNSKIGKLPNVAVEQPTTEI